LSETSVPSIWGMLQANAGIIALAVTVILWFAREILLREKKELAYVAESNRLLSLQDEIGGKLQMIDSDSKPVHDPHLVVVEVGNTGNKEIPREAFDRPVSFGFGNQAYIVSASVAEKSPGLEPEIPLIDDTKKERVTSRGDRVELQPLNLNAGDSFKISMIVGSKVAEFPAVKMDGHVAGVKIVRKREKLEPYKNQLRRRIIDAGDLCLFGVAVLGVSVWVPYMQTGACMLGSGLCVQTSVAFALIVVLRRLSSGRLRLWATRRD